MNIHACLLNIPCNLAVNNFNFSGVNKDLNVCIYKCLKETVAKEGCNSVTKGGVKDVADQTCYCMSGDECNRLECSEAGFASLGPEAPPNEKAKGGSGVVKVLLGWMKVFGAIRAILPVYFVPFE